MIDNRKELERLSSAFTLSDMEVFIFPELFYPLVLANIMSPIIWRWRDDPWFRDIGRRNVLYRINRVKQYIIQNYVFNLDLETWGLTDKKRELSRFSDFFDVGLLNRSNALFGYEGDKYYFDINIRKHFGLEKYDTDVIPYWKTETVEAMDAFRLKEGFTTGAGECVSLSALYSAALYIVAGIPLEDIFLVATPLHSQNFILSGEGILTNNRRIVTKNMWYNGTSLSAKARRALENEQVTIVANITGHIHTAFKDATIDRDQLGRFSDKLEGYLNAKLTPEIFINFLRFKSEYKKLFQYRADQPVGHAYLPLEKLFEYEHSSRYSVNSDSRPNLLKEIDGDEFSLSPINHKILINDIEDFISLSDDDCLEKLHEKLAENLEEDDNRTGLLEELKSDLGRFLTTVPRLPDRNKNFIKALYPEIGVDDTRETIISRINSLSDRSEQAFLARYVFRDMNFIDWHPFVKAAIERNNIAARELERSAPEEIYKILCGLPGESIYEGARLSMPDETWNFRRGDGIEKAMLMLTVLYARNPGEELKLVIDGKQVNLTMGGENFRFDSAKSLKAVIEVSYGKYSVS